jgi:hypothetical protein
MIVRHMQLTPTDKGITITCDARDPVAGNMSHAYTIDGAGDPQTIRFQHGPVAEAGVNGLTNEALIAIVIDRLEGAQEGQFRSRYNALALTSLQEAENWLSRRTLDRMSRGVEGQNKA